MSELTMKEIVARCQVRSGTVEPCSRPAAVKLRGIPFCERCAREQETYFAIGEFTEEEERGGGESLRIVMKLIRQIRVRQQMLGDHEAGAAA